MTKFWVRFRKQVVVNTDPQRRCYDGHHFSSKTVWTEWEDVCPYRFCQDAAQAVATFSSINPTHEYKVEERH